MSLEVITKSLESIERELAELQALLDDGPR